MGCYALMLKEAEKFVLSCHNFDCENTTSGAWVAAWKNKIRMKILAPLDMLTVTNRCCILSSTVSRLPTGSELGALEPYPPALGPTDHCLEWSTELFPTIINEITLLAQKWLSAKVAPCSEQCTCQYQSISCKNMLAACTWIYSCYFCHLCELIHLRWSIHCITVYYDFTYTRCI